MPPDHVLAVDQGTTSTRAMLFDRDARMVSVAQRELPQHYPRPGWVEHDAEDIWRDTLAVLREAIAGSAVPLDRIAAIGLTKRRSSGRPASIQAWSNRPMGPAASCYSTRANQP